MAAALSPAQLIQNLLSNATPQLRAQVLARAQQANQRALQQLEASRLASIESGWGDDWTFRHQRTTETLAAIAQALATC